MKRKHAESKNAGAVEPGDGGQKSARAPGNEEERVWGTRLKHHPAFPSKPREIIERCPAGKKSLLSTGQDLALTGTAPLPLSPSSPAAVRRKPAFSLTPRQVWKRCREQHKPQLCAGQVLALMSLMLTKDWTALELSGHSRVGRSTISEILSLKLSPTSVIWSKLAESCGFTLVEFDILASLEAQIQVSG